MILLVQLTLKKMKMMQFYVQIELIYTIFNKFYVCCCHACVHQYNQVKQRKEDKQAADVINMKLLLLFSLWLSFMCFPCVLFVKLAYVVILAQKEILYL